MAGQVELNATLSAIPTCGDGSFPSGMTTIPLALNPPNKPYAVTTGDQIANVNSPSVFVALGGIGAGGSVTLATTLMVRTSTSIALQLTQNNGGSGTNTITLGSLSGLFIWEAPTGWEIEGVSVKGSGTIEYWAGGAA
jgi:hypothetical protein